MNKLDEVMRLKKKVESLKASVERARGAADALRGTLRKDWDCDTLAEGRELLAEMKTKGEALNLEFDEKLAAFNDEWADELRNVE